MLDPMCNRAGQCARPLEIELNPITQCAEQPGG
jgi:hypothetical protein